MAASAVAAFGALFTLPQYFQAVLGVDAQDSGWRLLPLIAGLIFGAVPADVLAARIGAKLTVALGFVLLALGMAVGRDCTGWHRAQPAVHAWSRGAHSRRRSRAGC